MGGCRLVGPGKAAEPGFIWGIDGLKSKSTFSFLFIIVSTATCLQQTCPLQSTFNPWSNGGPNSSHVSGSFPGPGSKSSHPSLSCHRAQGCPCGGLLARQPQGTSRFRAERPPLAAGFSCHRSRTWGALLPLNPDRILEFGCSVVEGGKLSLLEQ